MDTSGFEPLVSFGAGGLAECWTGGAYKLTAEDLAGFPLAAGALDPFYDRVATRIGVGGCADDLREDMPLHAGLGTPVPLDTASDWLLGRYESRRDRLVARGVRLGRSRQATLSQNRDEAGRKGCTLCGRCLWGCPTGALYTPRFTLAACTASPRFSYRAGLFASHFETGADGRLSALIARDTAGAEVRLGAERFVLAAGTLSSSAIFLRSRLVATGEAPVLTGLMDNRQVLAPFLALGMLGRPAARQAYQYHQLAVVLDGADPAARVHGQITTFTNGQIHPVIQGLPLPLPAARQVFRLLRNGLGVVNLNFPDDRRSASLLRLGRAPSGDVLETRLQARYVPPGDEPDRIRAGLRQLGAAFRALGAPLLPGMAHVRPMGASVHYSGTLPMSAERRPLTVSPGCRSHDHDNLWIVDGSVMPRLPALNLTFTLMANATRVAATEF